MFKKYSLLLIYFLLSPFIARANVYVSFTTLPDRYDTLQHMTHSINWDNVTKVFVSIARSYKGTQYHTKEEYRQKFPADVQGRVEVLISEEDIGPGMKFVPVAKKLIQQGINPEDVLITVDDDIIYCEKDYLTQACYSDNRFVSEFLNKLSQAKFSPSDFANEAVAKQGVVTSLLGAHQRDESGSCIKTILGFSGVAYPLDLFNKKNLTDLEKYLRLDDNTKLSDDLVISWWLHKNTIPLFSLQPPYFCASMDQAATENAANDLRSMSLCPWLVARTFLWLFTKPTPIRPPDGRLMGAANQDGSCPEEQERYERALQTLELFHKNK